LCPALDLLHFSTHRDLGLVYPLRVTRTHAWRRGIPLLIGLAASGLITTAIADARVVDGCDLKPGTICEEMMLPFRGGVTDENLTEASFRKSDLSGAYVERTTLVRANLTETLLNDVVFLYGSLAGADLSGSASTGISFGGLSLRRATARDVTYAGPSFTAVDASGADFTGAEMPWITIKRTPTRGSTWANVDLTRAILTDARISETNMSGATLADADVSRATLSSVSLEGSDLSRINLSAAILRGVQLDQSRLPVATMVETEIDVADFTGAQVSGLAVQDATLRGAVFTRARGNIRVSFSNLTGRSDSGDYYVPNSFTAADLRESQFLDSDLRGVDFTGSDLRNADLSGSNIRTAIFDDADMRGVTLPDSALTGRPTFGCNRRTKWSGAYAQRFGDYCRAKGDRVKPSWCSDDFEKTPYLCSLCGQICIGGRGLDPRAEIVPTACDRRHQAAVRMRAAQDEPVRTSVGG
jgi:uncharacterized protein YjbI with pentapeptide repeats